MKEFYNNYIINKNIEKSSKISSFGGSTQLRRNLSLMLSFLNIQIVVENLDIKNIFRQQNKILFTQIIKCCSIGNVNNRLNNSSAIYPDLIKKDLRNKYLQESGHRLCIKDRKSVV